MQTTFSISAEQEHVFLVFIQMVAWPTLVWALKWMFGKMLRSSREVLHEIITENVNRVRDELKLYLDKQFIEHVNCDRAQFDAFRKDLKLPPSGL